MPIILGPFFAAITGSIGWVARLVLPALLSQVFLAVLTRIGLFVLFFIATNAAVGVLLTQATGYLSGLPSDLIQIMSLSGIVNALNIIASAYLFKLTLKIDSVKLLASKG